MTRWMLLLSLSLMPMAAWAGRPLFTDDAGITEKQSCQLEAWWQQSKWAQEGWLVPACNPLGNFEIAVGLSAADPDGAKPTKAYSVQGKTLFKATANGGYGAGLAFGLTRPGHGSGGSDYAYIPVSVASPSGTAVAHFNLGWLRDHALDVNRMTWSLAVEYAPADRLSFFGEAFGDDATEPSFQTGASYVVIPDRVHLCISYGHAGDAVGGHFYSIGANIYWPPF